MQVLKAFWLELRAKAPGCEGEAVTMRQLESLIRLAEARARCDLRPTVTEVLAFSVAQLQAADLPPSSPSVWHQHILHKPHSMLNCLYIWPS